MLSEVHNAKMSVFANIPYIFCNVQYWPIQKAGCTKILNFILVFMESFPESKNELHFLLVWIFMQKGLILHEENFWLWKDFEVSLSGHQIKSVLKSDFFYLRLLAKETL